jgi:antitoxin VapB
MKTAKVFKSGNSQAIRLPKEYRLESDEIFLNRIGNVLIIIPKDDPWSIFSQGIKEIGNDYPNKIKKLKHSKREELK